MIKRGEIRFRKEGYITHWESNPGLGKVVLLFAFITRAIQVFLYQPTKKTTTTKKSSGFCVTNGKLVGVFICRFR